MYFFAERVLLLSSHQGQETPYSLQEEASAWLFRQTRNTHTLTNLPVSHFFSRTTHMSYKHGFTNGGPLTHYDTRTRRTREKANVQESSLIPSERPAILIAVTSLDHRTASAAL